MLNKKLKDISSCKCCGQWLVKPSPVVDSRYYKINKHHELIVGKKIGFMQSCRYNCLCGSGSYYFTGRYFGVKLLPHGLPLILVLVE